jgi:hypothetical protein
MPSDCCKKRIEEELLRGILKPDLSLRPIDSWVSRWRRSKLQPKPGEPMPLQNRGFKVASGDTHGVDPMREDSMQLRRGIKHTKRLVVHHDNPESSCRGPMHEVHEVVSHCKAAHFS